MNPEAKRPEDVSRRSFHDCGELYQTNTRWRDLVLFYECFHGDKETDVGAIAT